ncbi:MAG TPA: hypothetical protein VJI69_09835 [Bacteroidia bacterium]|nr:hypothetical protein [Bacteroidia bacterium]
MNKKTILLILLSIISVSSMRAYDGTKLNALSGKPFHLKSGADEEGVKGKIIITAGVGLNLLGTTLELRYIGNTIYNFDGNIAGHDAWPMINGAVDYGLGKQVSVGVAFGYQKVTMNLKNVVAANDKHYDTWTRIHFAARGDYYIVAKENISLYTGVKLGYNLYSVSSTVPTSVYPGYTSNLWYPQPLSAQAHFGFSYFVKGMVGFNAEVGLGYGVPYLFAAGVTVKI